MKIPILVACVLVVAGCQTQPAGPSYINPAIAQNYADFYTQGATDPDAARNAIENAEKADPENAYTQYLKASLAAQKKDFRGALQLIEKGNAMPKVVHYVATPPPDDTMATLNRVRQLGYSVDEALTALPGDESNYLAAVRIVGARVANAEPVTSLGAVAGISIIRRTLDAEVKWSSKQNDKKLAAASKAHLDQFLNWSTEFSADMAEATRDLMQEAGKKAGLTEKELGDYAHGIPLKDAQKQKIADEAREAIYAQEIETLKRQLSEMPKF